MLVSFCFKASVIKKFYWGLGIATFLFIAAMISSQTSNDKYFRVLPSPKILLPKLTHSHQTTALLSSLTFTTAKSSPSQTDPVRNAGSTDAAFAIYILLDDESLKSGNAESQWDSLNHSMSSSCGSVRRICVRFLVDKKDSRRSDIIQFVARYFNTSASLCHESGTSTEFHTIEVVDLRKSTRALTQLMIRDYVLDNIAYFSVIFVPNTPYRGLPDLSQVLEQTSSDGVGIVVDSALQDSKHPSSLFFSKIHFEIFGWFLPPFLADLKLAVTYLFHIYPTNLTFTVLNESVKASIKGVKDPKTSGFTPAGLEALEMAIETLRRYLSVSRTSACFRCVNNTSHKVISMSLYGDKPRYTIGAIRNAQLLPIIFPGWRLWFYVELQLPGQPDRFQKVPTPVLTKLTELGAEIRYVNVSSTGLAPMLWRFTVAEDPDVDVFIVRDCDSRLTLRDAIVVSDWLETDKIFHCVRDHPSHSKFPISGGLWGAHRGPFAAIFGEGNLSSVMRRYGSSYMQDMDFLGSAIWPNVTHVAYCHDSYSCQRYEASHPFPLARIGAEHLGQVYDEFSLGRKDDMDIIRKTRINTKCVVATKNRKRR